MDYSIPRVFNQQPATLKRLIHQNARNIYKSHNSSPFKCFSTPSITSTSWRCLNSSLFRLYRRTTSHGSIFVKLHDFLHIRKQIEATTTPIMENHDISANDLHIFQMQRMSTVANHFNSFIIYFSMQTESPAEHT